MFLFTRRIRGLNQCFGLREKDLGHDPVNPSNAWPVWAFHNRTASSPEVMTI